MYSKVRNKIVNGKYTCRYTSTVIFIHVCGTFLWVYCVVHTRIKPIYSAQIVYRTVYNTFPLLPLDSCTYEILFSVTHILPVYHYVSLGWIQRPELCKTIIMYIKKILSLLKRNTSQENLLIFFVFFHFDGIFQHLCVSLYSIVQCVPKRCFELPLTGSLKTKHIPNVMQFIYDDFETYFLQFCCLSLLIPTLRMWDIFSDGKRQHLFFTLCNVYTMWSSL